MRTVDDYMDAARAAHQLTSDRKLAVALGVGPTASNHWRTKKAWPADDTIIRLAELAGLDTGQALLDLNRWRATTPAVQSAYDRIAARIAATAAVLILATLGIGQPSQASASETSSLIFHNKHYATFI